mgnify:CR=1 FL=1
MNPRDLDSYITGERSAYFSGNLACECSDPGCSAHKGASCENIGEWTLYRIDMHDETGTLFCEDCASCADSSGLYTDQSPQDREDSAVDAADRLAEGE